MTVTKLGRVVLKNSALFLCDMQEKFRSTIKYYPQILAVSARMLAAAKTLEMPVIVTEQYPRGLGHTVSELDVTGIKIFPKTQFSMMIPEVKEELKKIKDLQSIILCGIEAHACVQATTLELIKENYDVHVIVDAVSARSMTDRMFSLQRMREAGAFLTTSESMLLELVRDASHPKFREIQKIIWDSAPDSGLLAGKVDGETPV